MSELNVVEEESSKFEPAEHVIASPEDAKTAYSEVKQANYERIRRYVQIERQLRRFPPRDSAKMREEGLSYKANVNFGEAESVITSYKAILDGLVANTKTLTSTRILENDIVEPNNLETAENVVDKNFTKVLTSWRDFRKTIYRMNSQLISYGMSVIMWEDEKDPRFTIPEIKRVLFPMETLSRCDMISLCFIEYAMSIDKLWQLYLDAERGLAPHWDKEAIEQVLMHQMHQNTDPDREFDHEYFLAETSKVRLGHSSLFSVFNSDVSVVGVYVREHDGKVTRIIIHPNVQTEQFLYHFDRQYDSIEKAFQIVTLIPDDKNIEDVEGIGHRIFNSARYLSNSQSELLDTTHKAGLIWLKNTTAGESELQGVKIKADFADLGTSEVQQVNLAPSVTAHIKAIELLQNTLAVNNQPFAEDLAGEGHADLSPGTAKLGFAKDMSRQKPMITHYREQLDALYREVFRKMLELKKSDNGYGEFREYFDLLNERDGLPSDFFASQQKNVFGLPFHIEIFSTRAGSTGSQVGDLFESQALEPHVQTLGEKGRRRWLEDRIVAVKGPEYVARYLPPEDFDEMPTPQDAYAGLENNFLEQGMPVIFSPAHNHMIHATIHMQRLTGIIEAHFNERGLPLGQQSYNLQEADKAVRTLLPHIAIHIQTMEGDPTRAVGVQRLKDDFNRFGKAANEITNNAAAQRQAVERKQAEVDKALTEEDLELQKIILDNQRKTIDMQNKMERQKALQDNRDIMEQTKLAGEQQREFEKSRSKIALDTAETLAKIDSEALLTQAKASNIKRNGQLNESTSKVQGESGESS